MIEKLPFEITQGEYEGKKFDIKSATSPFDMQVTINELVDAVNSLRDDCNLLMGYIAPENKCEPAENRQSAKIAHPDNPYAEQRKWVGKLCRFWDDGCDSNYISLLKQIDDDDTPFVDDNGVCWEHCEPVKPDDDIIFKGE